MKPLTMSEAEALEDATSPEADFRVAGAIALVRGSWRNDGAVLELLRGDRAAAAEREWRAREAAAHYEREKEGGGER